MAVGVPPPQGHALFHHQGAAQLDFPKQRRHVGFNAAAIADFPGGEGAIGAAGLAEGDADIQIELVGPGLAQALLHPGDLAQQRRPVGGDIVGRFHVSHRRVQVHARLHGLVQQPRGAYAGQAAPGGLHAGAFFQQVVQRQLHLALAQALDLHRRALKGGPGEGTLVALARPAVGPQPI